MHKAWSSTEEVPYYFSKSSGKFQGTKNCRFYPNWAFPDLFSTTNVQTCSCVHYRDWHDFAPTLRKLAFPTFALNIFTNYRNPEPWRIPIMMYGGFCQTREIYNCYPSTPRHICPVGVLLTLSTNLCSYFKVWPSIKFCALMDGDIFKLTLLLHFELF